MTTQNLSPYEQERSHERFADFERAVLQDNIGLCDTKAGLVLAFSGAMVIFCLNTLVTVQPPAGPSGRLVGILLKALLLPSAVGFLASSQFSLATVIPRFNHAKDDYVFWESPVFQQSVESYLATMQALQPGVEQEEKLRHLHLLAAICRRKFRLLLIALRLAQVSFVTLTVGESVRLLT